MSPLLPWACTLQSVGLERVLFLTALKNKGSEGKQTSSEASLTHKRLSENAKASTLSVDEAPSSRRVPGLEVLKAC